MIHGQTKIKFSIFILSEGSIQITYFWVILQPCINK